MKNEMIKRKSYDEIPPKVEYSLTEKGLSVVPILQSICQWSGAYLLLEEEPGYRQQAMRFSQDVESQRRLLRSLMNVRYPGKSLNPEYLCL